MSIEGSKNIAGDDLFKFGLEISSLIRFAYKKDRIHIILDTLKLEKHWIYTMVEFLQSVVSLKNK